MINVELGLSWLSNELEVAEGLTVAIFTQRMAHTHRIFKHVEVEVPKIAYGPVRVLAGKLEALHLMDKELTLLKGIFDEFEEFVRSTFFVEKKKSQVIVLHIVLPFHVTTGQIENLTIILAEKRLMGIDGVSTPLVCLIDSPNPSITRLLNSTLIKQADRAFTDYHASENMMLGEHETMLVKHRSSQWNGVEIVNLVECHTPQPRDPAADQAIRV